MDRHFDYAQKILLAVEFGDKPRQLSGLPASYTLFQRLPMAEVTRAFADTHGLAARLLGAAQFRQVLDRHMAYWEERIPAGQSCFVHYVIGPEPEIAAAFARLRQAGGWALCGVYHIEPQASAYPFSFPLAPAPTHLQLGETRRFGPESVFWFNFFPAQPYLFEKTFLIWALFNIFQGREGGECNQLVALDGADRLHVDGVGEFVQVNLNRFTSLLGYFNAAHEAGKHSFTVDPDYLWYGMLLRQIDRHSATI